MLVCRLNDTNFVTYRWGFTLNYNLDGTINCHKTSLVAIGFSQQYDVDYRES